MPVSLSRKLAILQRRQKVAEMLLEGQTQAAIAEQLQLTQAAVSKDITEVRKLWRESAIRDFDELREQQLAKLDLIEREAWAAWKRSQQPAQTATVDGPAGTQKAKRTVRHQNGDPRFLQVTLESIAARRELLGLDAPTKIAPTTPDGKPLTNDERKLMIDAIVNERLGVTVVVTQEDADGTRETTLATSAGESDRRGIEAAEPGLRPLDSDPSASSPPG